jgi:hypothetical protein
MNAPRLITAIKPYAKAVIAGAVALTGGIAVGYADNSLTTGELWTAIAAGVAALGATFGVRNAK